MQHVVTIPTIHVPRISSVDLEKGMMESEASIVRMIDNLLSGKNFMPNLPPFHMHEPVILAASANVPDFGKPFKRTYYNYVIGTYKEHLHEHRRVHDGLVFRVGKYDPSTKKLVGKESWQVETRMGVKHLQLFSVDLNVLFSGVIINDPVEGLFISPSSGTWAKKKQSILEKLSLVVTDNTDILLDILNMLVTRKVIMEMASRGGKARPKKALSTETTGGALIVSDVVPGKIKVHKFHDRDECMSSYVRLLEGGKNSVNARCRSNIPQLYSSQS